MLKRKDKDLGIVFHDSPHLLPRDPIYYHGSHLIPACVSYHMQTKVGDEITYPFSNFIGAAVVEGDLGPRLNIQKDVLS